MGLLSSIFSAAGDFMGNQAEKKQAKKSVQDYIGARDNAISGFAGARDASLGYYQPYAEGGQQGFQNALNMQSGDFQYSPSDPSYAWRLSQGVDAIDRSASARGTMNSGGTLKALTAYGQGLGSTEFQNDFARNNQLAGYGLQAAQGQAQAQSGYAAGNANALFRGADGITGYRQKKGEAIAGQWGDVASAANSVGKFFGF